jgi:hypothetical protein
MIVRAEYAGLHDQIALLAGIDLQLLGLQTPNQP